MSHEDILQKSSPTLLTQLEGGQRRLDMMSNPSVTGKAEVSTSQGHNLA